MIHCDTMLHSVQYLFIEILHFYDNYIYITTKVTIQLLKS